jgi:hypothetical protein
MYRLLICLLLCLPFAPDARELLPEGGRPTPGVVSHEPLPVADPLSFLEKCLERYEKENIKGYSVVMHKQERIGGALQPSEDVECVFREKPHAVFMHWVKGARKAATVIYVEGENDGKMLVKPAGVAGVLVKSVLRDPEGDEARQSGRYTVKQFGLKKAAERTLKAWKTAKQNGTLHVQYLGISKVREIGDRECYTIRRTCDKPEEDGVTEVTVYIDKENWMQVRSVLKGEGGKVIGEYDFRDLRLNPDFKPDQFQRSALTS